MKQNAVFNSGSNANADAPYALCERPPSAGGFTLIEVMIAMFVFFLVVFSILVVVVQCLGAARSLQVDRPPAGMVASMLSLSNCCDEGAISDDFGDTFPNYRWESETTEAGTNAGGLSLWQVDIAVYERTRTKREVAERLQMLMARPPCTRRR